MMHRLLRLSLWILAAVTVAHAAEPPVAGGIGATVARSRTSPNLTFDYVAAHGPADEAHIQAGDDVTAVNGVPTSGMSMTEVSSSIDGDIGGVVKLTIRRGQLAGVQVSIVRRSVLDSYLPAAKEGDPRAQFYVGHFYEHGPTSAQDPAAAVEWYRKSAGQGYARAEVNLAYLLRHGTGVTRDLATAAAWDLKAANQGDSYGEVELGYCYKMGEGVPQDDVKAFAWFYSAARQDDPVAEHNLGLLYRAGRGVKRDDRAAFGWYYRCAEQGDAYGEWGLAYIYEYGFGVPSNLGEALKWYQKAHAALPHNEKLGRMTALVSLRAFVESPGSTPIDLPLLLAVFHREIFLSFLFLTPIYVAGGAVLLYFSLRRTEAPPKVSVAIGWLMFYLESQGVALLAVVLLGKSFTAKTLIVAMSLFGALPVIASSFGPQGSRLWKASPIPWRKLVLYTGCLCAVFCLLGFAYTQIYAFFTHAPLPLQPTRLLILKAKHASAWWTYAVVAGLLPVAEEIIFRGYLFDALRRRFSGNTTVIITALGFSLVHFQLLYFVPLAGIGLILGWARLKTDSLRFPVFLHLLNNGLFLVLAT
jgi:TPR repeat protein/membrane protease YdiL (CAAX protease family)